MPLIRYKIKNNKKFNDEIIQDINYILDNYKDMKVIDKSLTYDYIYIKIKYNHVFYEFKIDICDEIKNIEYGTEQVYILFHMMFLIIKHHLKEDLYFIDNCCEKIFNKNAVFTIPSYLHSAIIYLKDNLNMEYKFLRIIEYRNDYYTYKIFSKETIDCIYMVKCDNYIFDCSQKEIQEMSLSKAITFKNNNPNFFFTVYKNKIKNCVMIEFNLYFKLMNVIKHDKTSEILDKMISLTNKEYNIIINLNKLEKNILINKALDIYLKHIYWNNNIELAKLIRVNNLISALSTCNINTKKDTIIIKEFLNFITIPPNKHSFFRILSTSTQGYKIQTDSPGKLYTLFLLLFYFHIDDKNIPFKYKLDINNDFDLYPKEKEIYENILRTNICLNTFFNLKNEIFRKYTIFSKLKYFEIKSNGDIILKFINTATAELFSKKYLSAHFMCT